MESNAIRRACFIEEDDGLASLADMEAGFSGNHNNHNHSHNNNQHQNHPFLTRTLCYSASYNRRGSFRNFSVSSPRSGGRFYDARFEEHQPHFLEACFLCKKPLGDHKDIFMYRGDTPFCSEECRQEQIEIDEAKENDWNLSSSVKAMRKKQQRESTSPGKSKAQDYIRTSTVAAA